MAHYESIVDMEDTEDMPRLRTMYFDETGRSASDEDIVSWIKRGKVHPPTSAIQEQVGGSHYKNMAIQPWEYFTANASIEEIRGACKQNLLKYMRQKTDTVEDLKKARWYLNEWIKLEESANA